MWNGTIFVDLDWPLNASSLLSASAELLVNVWYCCKKKMLNITWMDLWQNCKCESFEAHKTDGTASLLHYINFFFSCPRYKGPPTASDGHFPRVRRSPVPGDSVHQILYGTETGKQKDEAVPKLLPLFCYYVDFRKVAAILEQLHKQITSYQANRR